MGLRSSSKNVLPAALGQLDAAARRVVSLVPGKRPKWVVVELSGSYPARAKRRPWIAGLPLPAELGLSETSLEELEQELRELGDAPWLEGVVFRAHDLHVDWATAFALRRLLGLPREAGKKTLVWLAELSLVDYYLATAAEQIAVPPSAELHLFGFGVSVTFARRALDKLGVRFEKLAIDEYKNAFDNLAREEMSAPHREQLDALLASLEAHFVDSVAKARGLESAAVRAAVDDGFVSAPRALELRLVDRVAYEDEVVPPESAPSDETARFLPPRLAPLVGPRVGVVSLQGLIVTGRSRRSPLAFPGLGSMMSGADSVAQALRAAVKDERTAAIVLYVSSGGGSALASDLLWREIRKAGERKPVVAVLGSVAASGGYYAACAAKRIIAAPGTITGSIGVVTGKLVVAELYERLGLRAEHVSRGRFALWTDPTLPLEPAARELLRRTNQEVYDRFVSCVCAGRGMARERVHELGRGRIWSGTDALGVGLVDELGDVRAGIERAAELAGLPRDCAAWNVRAPSELLLPTAADPTTARRALGTLLQERALLLQPDVVSLLDR